jgi:hypothetical protein
VIGLELDRAVHALTSELQAAQSRLDHALLLARDGTTNDERIKLLTSSASGLQRMLDAIETATTPDPVDTTEPDTR